MPVGDAEIALLALEVQGQAMRGRFRSPAPVEEWCDRRLLARIHRYTLKTLRRAVEPVSPAAYMRFLLRWHQLGDDEPLRSPTVCGRRSAGWRAFPLPAAAWEGSLLPARLRVFRRRALDQVLAGGEFLWLRPAATRGAAAARADPHHADPVPGAAAPGPVAVPVARGLRASDGVAFADSRHGPRCCWRHGAMFFLDLLRATGLARNGLEAGLRELVAAGLVNGDGYAGLRTLLATGRAAARGRVAPFRSSAELPGRWSLVMPQLAPAPAAGDAAKRRRAAVTHVALVLLERYGVVFRSVLQREARFLPPWRELAQALRRLEARGEIRGGRFVAGFGGEQFALPEAIDRLREVRHAGNRTAR